MARPSPSARVHHASSPASAARTKGAARASARPAASARKSATLSNRLMRSPGDIWKSRLSWRITLVVFLTILTVQVGIMSMTIADYRQKRLDEISESARSAIVPLIEERIQNLLTSPISEEEARRVLETTRISGFSVYSVDFNLLRAYGEPLVTRLALQNGYQAKNRLSGDGTSYEVIFRPRNLFSRPFVIVVKIDSSSVQQQVFDYVEQNILVMLLMSAFVTTVLMMALGYWLLEPILFLRSNLMRASENPENPRVERSPFNPTDEIGSAIDIALSLIKQNADNIKRIKSAAQDQIHKLAYFDTLTSLPNRTLFLQKLNEMARAQGAENPGRYAVIALDLDHFKDINDSMGHNVGDAILRGVAKRLRASLPEQAIVARSGEDEFAITMPLTGKAITSRDVADRVIGVIRAEPFKVFNENFQIRSSIGVATFPDDGVDPDQVLKHADIALNRAKEDGRDTIKEYSEDYDRAVQLRFQMLRDLRDAMEKNQLLLYYQPQLDLKSGKVIGAEALIRWWKPDSSKEGGHFISPAEFIPIAEQSGLIVPIGEWVMKTAVETAMAWRQAGYEIRIAVNVSGAQFYQSDIVAYTSKILRESGLPPHQLELEVTESVFMEDIQHTITILQNLHNLGVELAIDDFGTGYSSLSYLRQFPIDRLKIDQSFIRNALQNPDDAAIARTIVALGHSLSLKVIAEGVETKEHEAFLQAQNCDEVQGFRYSRPIPKDKFAEFAATYNGDINSFNMN
ncbi:MAG: EAL domain-containing protein [Micavibrio aeruginosavorus]|uniref:EAL domain-containing protein n=1 Tax=Micavibrio aeruginosavorus TaxID=349221 RepID=A0A7T5UI22_9BACT|nr:MAG: EAL domain-containing protein [Micavibrio aeruginosavorus]